MRTEAGLNQRELARPMGTTPSAISRLEEGGGAKNRLDTLARVATALYRPPHPTAGVSCVATRRLAVHAAEQLSNLASCAGDGDGAAELGLMNGRCHSNDPCEDDRELACRTGRRSLETQLGQRVELLCRRP